MSLTDPFDQFEARFSPETRIRCDFGITEFLGATIGSALASAGVGAETAGIIGSIAGPAVFGAGTGALEQAVTGGDPGKGALFGGLTGGALGAAGDVLGGVTSGGGAPPTGGTSAAAVTPPGGVPAGTTADLTSATATLGGGGGLTIPGAAPPDIGTIASGIAPPPINIGTPAPPGVAGIGQAFDTLTGGTSPSPVTSTGPAGATTGTAAGAASGGNGNPWSLGNLLTPKNALSVLGLGYTALQHQGNTSLENQLQTTAQSLAQQGGMMTQFLSSGKLPAGVQEIVDAQTAGAEAQVRSSFAEMGLSGSTMESQAIAQVKEQAAVNTFNIADRLLSAGVQESELSSQLYQNLIQDQTAQNNQLMEAIAQFASAAGGYALPKTG